MSVRVMGWVWQTSRSKGTDRLVLLAVADCAADDGGNAWPSMAALVAKTGLTDRGIQKAMARLVALGELRVDRNEGPRGCNRYRVIMSTPEHGSPPNVVHPERGSGAPERGSPLPPNVIRDPPERGSPGTVLEPSREPSHKRAAAEAAASAPARTLVQRSKALTDAYHAVEPMSRWPAVNAIVLKALKTERWSDGQIGAALLRLAADNRPVTVDTLRVELTGPPTARASPNGMPTTDRKVAAGLALAAKYGALDQQETAQRRELSS